MAERIRHATGASFVVVANLQGIRYSHPDPAKIGKKLSTDPSIPLTGGTYVGVQTGSLGKSVRAKVPIYGVGGEVIGLVSVGLLEKRVTAHLISDLPVILIPPALGLLLGVAGSFLLARRIKRQTFGLEPDEIATLLEHREAMLHGIREGAVAVDTRGHVTLVNDEAKRLLGLDSSAIGKHLAESVPSGRVRDVLLGTVDRPDQVVLVDDHVLVVNRMPVSVRGQEIGAVITLRDRTELEGLLRELDDVRSLAEALRAGARVLASPPRARGTDRAGALRRRNSLHQEVLARAPRARGRNCRERRRPGSRRAAAGKGRRRVGARRGAPRHRRHSPAAGGRRRHA